MNSSSSALLVRFELGSFIKQIEFEQKFRLVY
jgi:hypothetical protein